MTDEDIPELIESDWARARVVSPEPPAGTPLCDRDFSDAAYAAIGRLTRSASILEHELMRATIGLEGGPAVIEGGGADATGTEKKTGDSLSARLGAFVAAYEATDGEPGWLADFREKIEQAALARNHFAHGQWREYPDGRLRCVFCKKRPNPEKPKESVWMGWPSALSAIAEANMANAQLLHDRFHDVNGQAAE